MTASSAAMWLLSIKCSSVFTGTGEQVVIWQPLVNLAQLVSKACFDNTFSRSYDGHDTKLINSLNFTAQSPSIKRTLLLSTHLQKMPKKSPSAKTLRVERVTPLMFINAWWHKRSEAPLVNRELQFGVCEREH